MRKGFTLMELIVVVIIIGILAMIGLPQFFKVAERGRAAEAFSALGSLRSAQIRYAVESSTHNTTNSLDNLDVNVTGLRYFNTPPTVYANVNPQTSPTSVVASVTRSDGTYTVNITAGGTLSCAPADKCPTMPQ